MEERPGKKNTLKRPILVIGSREGLRHDGPAEGFVIHLLLTSATLSA